MTHHRQRPNRVLGFGVGLLCWCLPWLAWATPRCPAGTQPPGGTWALLSLTAGLLLGTIMATFFFRAARRFEQRKHFFWLASVMSFVLWVGTGSWIALRLLFLCVRI